MKRKIFALSTVFFITVGLALSGCSDGNTDTSDTTAPDAPVITTPAYGATINTSTLTAGGTAEADSAVKLFDTDGTTSLGTATATATGGNWSIAISTLSNGAHSLTATATDAAGNTSSSSAAVSITVDTGSGTGDTTAPVITLSGSTPMSVEVNSIYTEPGATASDNYDGDITANIVIGGDTVITAVAGAYIVTYNVTDAAGNPAIQVTRTVSVEDTIPPNLSSGAPSGVLSSGTTYASLTVTTDADAICKYTTTTGGVDYSTMANTFSSSGGSTHSTYISGFSDGQTYNYYVRCRDGAGNVNTSDYLIAFAVARVGDAYYVATTGNDANSGTINQPWRTIAFATCGGTYSCPVSTNNPNKLQAGDTLYIRGGTYAEKNIRVANSGVNGSPITIMGYTGEVAIVDGGFVYDPNVGGGARPSARNPVFDVDRVNYITFDGLTIRRGETANIFLGYDYSTTNIIIQNSDLKEYVPVDNSANIYINGGADDITIQNNYLHDMQGTGGNAAGIIIFNAGVLTIKNNEIYSTYQGIYYKHSRDNGKLTIVENNLIHDQAIFGIQYSNADSIIRNNIIRDVGSPGIRIFSESSVCDSLVSDNNQILHNTIVDTSSSAIYLSRSTSCPGAVNTLVKDNLLYNFTNNEMRGLAVWPYGINYGATQDVSYTTFDHNLIYSNLFLSPIRILATYYDVSNAPLTGTGNIQSKPIFEDYTNKVFTLSPGSPGKNAASDGTDMGANVCAIGVDPSC